MIKKTLALAFTLAVPEWEDIWNWTSIKEFRACVDT